MDNKSGIKSVSTSSEIESVVRLADEIWREHYVPIIGEMQVDYMLDKYQSVHAIEKQLQDGTQYYLLLNNGVPAGYFSFYPKKYSLFLSKIYIRKNTRGLGLGKDAIEFLYKKAREASKSIISLTVNKNNSNSIAAYNKMGFKIIKPLVTDIGSGYVMDDYYMEKVLTPS